VNRAHVPERLVVRLRVDHEAGAARRSSRAADNPAFVVPKWRALLRVESGIIAVLAVIVLAACTAGDDGSSVSAGAAAADEQVEERSPSCAVALNDPLFRDEAIRFLAYPGDGNTTSCSILVRSDSPVVAELGVRPGCESLRDMNIVVDVDRSGDWRLNEHETRALAMADCDDLSVP
jgi:hypothetical protein